MPLMPSMVMPNYPSALAVALFYHAAGLVGLVLALVVLGLWLLRRGSPAGGSPAFHPARLQVPAREGLVLWLGVLWTLDGFLQAQPAMVTRFIGGFLAPLLSGQPGFVRAVVDLGIRLWGMSPIWWNVGAAYLQLVLGLSLLFARDGSGWRRWALVASAVWGLAVWAGGEAFGSLFSGGGPLVGSPGSGLLYALAAGALLWPAERWLDPRWRRWGRWFWIAWLSLMAALEAWPANGWWTVRGLAGYVRSMATMPQPSWFSGPLYAWHASLALHPVAWNAAILAAILAVLALWLFRPSRPATLWTTVVFILAVWYFGQDLGVLGGMGTDPNTGAILLGGVVAYGRLAGVWGHGVAPAPAPAESSHGG